MDKSSSLGMPMSPQEISNKYKRQSLGMPKASPSSSTKISCHLSRHYIFIASYIMCYSRSVSYFCFQFCFVLFAVAYGWILTYLFGEIPAPLSLSRTLEFSLFLVRECSLFASTAFSSCFSLIFCSELDVLLSMYMNISLVFNEYFL